MQDTGLEKRKSLRGRHLPCWRTSVLLGLGGVAARLSPSGLRWSEGVWILERADQFPLCPHCQGAAQRRPSCAGLELDLICFPRAQGWGHSVLLCSLSVTDCHLAPPPWGASERTRYLCPSPLGASGRPRPALSRPGHWRPRPPFAEALAHWSVFQRKTDHDAGFPLTRFRFSLTFGPSRYWFLSTSLSSIKNFMQICCCSFQLQATCRIETEVSSVVILWFPDASPEIVMSVFCITSFLVYGSLRSEWNIEQLAGMSERGRRGFTTWRCSDEAVINGFSGSFFLIV